jgi:DNA topoisomerase-1
MLDDSGQTILDPQAEAERAGLIYVSTGDPGILRRRSGKGFTYRDANDERIADADVIRRIQALAVPPAWRDVWICTQPNGHIQAVGYDADGRKQYRYHADFRALREGAKFDHMLAFARALPALRARVAEDMRGRGLGRAKVLATVVQLLETTMIRVGNPAYARDNKSYGLTTLRGRHVQVDGGALRFHFKGKSGRVWRLGVQDRRVARIVQACQELPGQHLFQYVDDEGDAQAITSADINAYLREASGQDITAKDFRTWAGTVLAAEALCRRAPAASPSEAKRMLRDVVQEVAARLGNTPTICRKCYIHPEVQDAYLCGELDLGESDEPSNGGLRPEEAAVLGFLETRLSDPRRAP